ncbi:MAG TPA: thioester reductase domain-containing protein [Rubrobacter sp.]|nr:thioester reductase domain-containing protein [Rubrobacter sp.]
MSHRLSYLSPKEKRALLAQLLLRKSGNLDKLLEQVAVNVENLEAEAALDPRIRPTGTVSTEVASRPERVLLTGATGFLGSFLLAELLRHTRAEIHCLVRAPNVEEGERRIRGSLETYALWDEKRSPRIFPVAGDLSEPLLGLGDERFEELADEIDVVYHNGASVNWVYPYDALKPTNVLGTQEVLRLASRHGTKPVHFVSTLGVFPLVGRSDAGVVREDDDLDHGGSLYNGYTQTKWVAEKLVEIARARGLPVSVYRPSLIAGDSRTGAWNKDDFTCKMIKSWVGLGNVPDVNTELNMVPVDYVSRAIIRLSLQEGSLGKRFHLANSHPVKIDNLISWIEAFGYPLKRIPYDRWRTELLNPVKGLREDAMYSAAPLLSMSATIEGPKMVRAVPEFDRRNTTAALASTGISCPPVNAGTFEKYLVYLVRSGFLASPTGG